MKATFEIKWPDSLGPGWMNVDNLLRCLITETYVGEKISLKVKRLPDKIHKENEAKRSVAIGGHDEW